MDNNYVSNYPLHGKSFLGSLLFVHSAHLQSRVRETTEQGLERVVQGEKMNASRSRDARGIQCTLLFYVCMELNLTGV